MSGAQRERSREKCEREREEKVVFRSLCQPPFISPLSVYFLSSLLLSTPPSPQFSRQHPHTIAMSLAESHDDDDAPFSFSANQLVLLENYYHHVNTLPDEQLLRKLTSALGRMDRSKGGVSEERVRKWFEWKLKGGSGEGGKGDGGNEERKGDGGKGAGGKEEESVTLVRTEREKEKEKEKEEEDGDTDTHKSSEDSGLHLPQGRRVSISVSEPVSLHSQHASTQHSVPAFLTSSHILSLPTDGDQHPSVSLSVPPLRISESSATASAPSLHTGFLSQKDLPMAGGGGAEDSADKIGPQTERVRGRNRTISSGE